MCIVISLYLSYECSRSISGEEGAGDSDDEEELDSDTEEQEASADYVKGEHLKKTFTICT